jgi:tyrosine-protein kinase Etk/Wzc
MSSNVERRISEIDQNISRLVERRREFESFEARRGSDATQRAEVIEINRQIAEFEREKTTLNRQYVGEVMDAGGIASPQTAFAYVTNLKEQVANERVALSGLQGKISTASSRIAQLEAELGRVPSTTTALARSESDRAHSAQMYEFIVGKLQQTQIAEESEPGYARILRAASTPMIPFGPGPMRNLGLALLGGLGLGLVLAIGYDKLDNRIYKPDDVTALGLQVIEAIPDLKPLIKDEFDGAAAVEYNGRKMASELITLHAPLSPASETYRHLRTSVQFSRPGVVVRSIVVTSAGPGEGKSTTAANLAITLAQAGRRTVLIDADIRRPRQHEIFGVSGERGLAQMLDVADMAPSKLTGWLETHFSSGVENLFMVPTGAIAAEGRPQKDEKRKVVPNPSELLGSPEMRTLIRMLLDTVDVVIIDTPPVLAATDAVLMSTQADATILITRAGKTKTGDAEQALAHLDDVGAQIVGGVLNQFSLEHAFGYAYSYGHYSRYGPYSKYGPYSEGRRGKNKKKSTRTPGPSPVA